MSSIVNGDGPSFEKETSFYFIFNHTLEKKIVFVYDLRFCLAPLVCMKPDEATASVIKKGSFRVDTASSDHVRIILLGLFFPFFTNNLKAAIHRYHLVA